MLRSVGADGAGTASAASSPHATASSAKQGRRDGFEAGLRCRVSAMCSRTTNQCQRDKVSACRRRVFFLSFHVYRLSGSVVQEACGGIVYKCFDYCLFKRTVPRCRISLFDSRRGDLT